MQATARRVAIAMATSAAFVLSGTAIASAQDNVAKIGVLTDQSGPYQYLGGAGSTLAPEMAIEDSGLRAKGGKIDLVSGDHQNKPDDQAGF